MRSALLVAFLLLACLAAGRPFSNPVLVLVEPGLPGLFDPEVDPNTFVHETWIRWPEEALPPHGNRLLSVATGNPWAGNARDFQFASAGAGRWRSENFEALRARGHFKARDPLWGVGGVVALQNMAGNARRDAMLLALDSSSAVVAPVPLEEEWPTGKTMVIEARRGEEVARLSQLTTGRMLVVEYPPRAGENRSRFWLRGQGWPQGVPTEGRLRVPGLIRAETVASLLLRPDSLRWDTPSPTWSGANRWMDYAQRTRAWVMWVAGIAIAGGMVAAAWTIGQERRSAGLSVFLRSLFLLPAALVLGGNLARFGGLNGAVVWMAVSMAAVVGLSALANFVFVRGRWGTPIAGYALVSALVLLATDPRYSIWSGAFGRIERDVPPEALGALVASLAVGLSALAPWSRGARMGAWIGISCLVVSAAFLPVWWKGNALLAGIGIVLIPLAVWRRARLPLFGVGLIEGLLIAPQATKRGFAFLPDDLALSFDQAGAVNAYDYVRFLVSPLLLIGLLLAGMFVLFGAGFFNHQVRFAWREATAARIALGSAGLLAALGLASPTLLLAAPIVALAAAIALGEHLLRPLD